MIEIKFGNYDYMQIGKFARGFRLMDAELKEPITENMTLKEIGLALGKQYGINEGQIELYHISFNYIKKTGEVNGKN